MPRTPRLYALTPWHSLCDLPDTMTRAIVTVSYYVRARGGLFWPFECVLVYVYALLD
jgi:hypothetical protein